ncbi:MAG: hypothetical protein K2X93_28900 [Candidatus Obscuribacterales bacterium]|nr:hypothetical protein [Candidatus Obscuribacterales bacterium]
MVVFRKLQILPHVASVVTFVALSFAADGLAFEAAPKKNDAPNATNNQILLKPSLADNKNAHLPLTALVKGFLHEGWEDLGTTIYRVEGGKLIIADQIPATNTQSQSSPLEKISVGLTNNDVTILEEFACKFVVQRTFSRGSRFITIRAYEFSSPAGANAGYDLLRKGSTTVVKRGDGSSEDSDSISFWQSYYLFVIAGTSEDDDESKEVVTKIATQISTEVRLHAQPPAILSPRPVVDRVRGTEKIVMGPVSAAKYFPAPVVENLSLEKALSACVADYQLLQPVRERMKLLYIDFKDPSLAKTSYDAYTAALTQLHGPERDWPEEERSLFRINKTFLYCQLKQPGKLIIISGARKAKSPMLLSGQIR